MSSPASIGMLQRAGLDFANHAAIGVDPARFAELLISSGLVLVPDVRWITFHAGYDLGYLVRLLTQRPLPGDSASFLRQCRSYFPELVDLKFALRHDDELHGGLARIARLLGVQRRGTAHQAGSDSLMTADVFFALARREAGMGAGSKSDGRAGGKSRGGSKGVAGSKAGSGAAKLSAVGGLKAFLAS